MAKKAVTNRGWLIDVAVFAGLYVLFALILPAPAPMTRGGMTVVGILCGTVYLWIKVDIGWPSMLFLGLIGLSGVTSPSALFQQTWGNTMVPFLISAFLLNLVMADTGLTRRFALFFITRKMNRGRPWRTLFMFFLAVMLMGLVSTSSAITVMFMAIAEEIFKMTGYKKGDRLPEAMMVGIFWVAQGAMAFTPISHVLIPMVFEYLLADFGITVTYSQYTLGFIGCGAAFFIGWILLLRFVIKPDVKQLATLDMDALKATVKPWSKQEKTVLVVYLAVICLWCFPDLIGLIPGMDGVASWMSSLGSAVPPMVACGVLCFIHFDGKPMRDFKDCCRRIPWNSVFMMATVMGMAYIFGLESCGITAWLTGAIAPIMGGLSPVVFTLAVCAFVVIATDFISNTLIASMYAIIIPIALTIEGCNPIVVGLLIAAGCNSSFSFPSGCPAASMATGGGWTRVSFQFKYGMLLDFWIIAMYMLTAYPILLKLFPY